MPNDLFNGNDEAKFTRMSENCKPKWEKSYSRWVVEKPIGECSTITKDDDFITFWQEVHYDNPDIFKQLDVSKILTKKNAYDELKVSFKCHFTSKVQTVSARMSIEGSKSADGKVSAIGEWDSSFKLQFVNNDFSTERSTALVGHDMFLKASWTIGNMVVGQKLSWYLTSCTISDTEDENKSVVLMKDSCISKTLLGEIKGVDGSNVSSPTSSTRIATTDLRIKYMGFSFSRSFPASQKASCDVQFCLVDDCPTDISSVCPAATKLEQAYQYELV